MSQDPIPPKLKKGLPNELRFTIPRSLRDAFVAEPRLLVGFSGSGVLLFSRQQLKAVLEDEAFFKEYDVVAIPKNMT